MTGDLVGPGPGDRGHRAIPADQPAPIPAPSRRRPRAKRGEGDRLREDILSATERLLIATGDQGAVSIRAIADAAGVTPPSIYLHFADKEALLLAVSERHFRKLGEAMEEAAAAGTDDPLESLRLRGKAYVRFGRENPEQYRILFMTRPVEAIRPRRPGSTPTDTPAGMSARVLGGPSGFAELVGAVQTCMDAGVFRADNPLKVASGLWTNVHGITSLLIARPDFPWLDAEGLVDHVLLVHALGLAVDPDAPQS